MQRVLVATAVAAVLASCSTTPEKAGGTSASTSGKSSAADWATFGGGNARYNANLAPTKITAANVGSMVRMQVKISAPIDAGLIYLKGAQVNGASHDVFFGTTIMGRTVAIDANTGAVLWETTVAGFDEGAAFNGATIPMGLMVRQITNSSPVADTNRQFVYAGSPDGKVSKISIADGKVLWSTAVTRMPNREKLDSPLAFVNGKLLVSTAGYVGDSPPYQGHIVSINPQSGAIEKIWNSLCSDRTELMDPTTCPQNQSAIWGRAGIVVDPASGNLLFATGNGNYDGKTAWGDALIMLDPVSLKMTGNWTPTNNDALNKADLDVGSTTPALLGDGYMAQGGKDGNLRLLHMDIIKGTAANTGKDLQIIELPGKPQMLTAPVVAKVDGKTWLFVSVSGRGGGSTTAFTFGADHKLTEAWRSTTGGTTPFYAGGLLYVYNPAAQGSKLNVLDAATGKAVAALDAGASHWAYPIVVDNRIALPEVLVQGFGGRGGPPGGAAPAAAAVQPIPGGIVNIWKLP